MNFEKRKYEFDKKLETTNDIKFIDKEIVNRTYQRIDCDRCGFNSLKYINIIRIEIEYYNIGNDCYQSIKNNLKEKWGISLRFVRDKLEEDYDKYLQEKHRKITPSSNSIKSDPDYSRYLTLKWDCEHSRPPERVQEEFRELQKKFKDR